jgi:hypothetical protein
MDYMTGQLYVQPNARSAGAQALVRGGLLNSVAREVLPQYDVPIMGGFSYSVPLHIAHPEMRGTSALDCLHYCSFGLPEILIYELTRTLRMGRAGVSPLSGVDTASSKWQCVPT